MEIKEVKFKRFVASGGMALKWKELYWDYSQKKFKEGYTWALGSIVIDTNNLVGQVEEIPISQYEQETEHCGIGMRGYR